MDIRLNDQATPSSQDIETFRSRSIRHSPSTTACPWKVGVSYAQAISAQGGRSHRLGLSSANFRQGSPCPPAGDAGRAPQAGTYRLGVKAADSSSPARSRAKLDPVNRFARWDLNTSYSGTLAASHGRHLHLEDRRAPPCRQASPVPATGHGRNHRNHRGGTYTVRLGRTPRHARGAVKTHDLHPPYRAHSTRSRLNAGVSSPPGW